MTSSSAAALAERPDRREEIALDKVREALRHIEFGTIALTVHYARIVQIDITEKRRLET